MAVAVEEQRWTKPTKPSSPSREGPRCPPEQTSPCLGQGGASIQGPDQGRTPERVRVEAMRRTYRETIHRNETLDSGEAKTLRKQFVSRSVYSHVNIMHAINIRSTKYYLLKKGLAKYFVDCSVLLGHSCLSWKWIQRATQNAKFCQNCQIFFRNQYKYGR